MELCNITEISELGAYKTIITFETQQSALEALSKNRGALDKYLDDIRAWSEEEWSQTRRVCIECYRIPSHACSVENISKIGEEWGTMVSMDKATEERRSVSATTLQIDTCVMQTI